MAANLARVATGHTCRVVQADRRVDRGPRIVRSWPLIRARPAVVRAACLLPVAACCRWLPAAGGCLLPVAAWSVIRGPRAVVRDP